VLLEEEALWHNTGLDGLFRRPRRLGASVRWQADGRWREAFMWAVPGWALAASIREVRWGCATLGGPAWPAPAQVHTVTGGQQRMPTSEIIVRIDLVILSDAHRDPM
jgi:hypothetical protein